jgi:hypothetical protein
MDIMPVVERSISLNVPVEMAFQYLYNPTHLPEVCPSVIEVDDVQHHTMHSTDFKWTFKMVGVRFEGGAEFVATRHNQRMDIQFWGGIRGHLTWQLHPNDEGVCLETEVEYKLPTLLLHKHSEEQVVQHNMHAVDLMLKRVKMLLESKVVAQLVV